MSESRKPFWAKCRKCAHIWAVAYLPMPMDVVAKVMARATCPMCGDRKPGIAKQTDGTLDE